MRGGRRRVNQASSPFPPQAGIESGAGRGSFLDQCRAPSPAMGMIEEPRRRALEHPPRGIRTVRNEKSLQQRELHQIELGAAAADAFELADNRFKRVDNGEELLPLESGEGARHRRNKGAGWITALAREFVNSP